MSKRNEEQTQLNAALDLLAKGTDEAMFAGMLVLVKYVSPDTFKAQKITILHSLKCQNVFFRRLLRSALGMFLFHSGDWGLYTHLGFQSTKSWG